MAVSKARAAIEASAVELPKAPAPELQSSEKKPDGNSAGFCIYIGPSITGVIQSGAILPGTRAQALDTISAAVEKYPLIAALVVDGKTLPEDRIKVKTPGNLLYVNYHKLASGKK